MNCVRNRKEPTKCHEEDPEEHQEADSTWQSEGVSNEHQVIIFYSERLHTNLVRAMLAR